MLFWWSLEAFSVPQHYQQPAMPRGYPDPHWAVPRCLLGPQVLGQARGTARLTSVSGASPARHHQRALLLKGTDPAGAGSLAGAQRRKARPQSRVPQKTPQRDERCWEPGLLPHQMAASQPALPQHCSWEARPPVPPAPPASTGVPTLQRGHFTPLTFSPRVTAMSQS